jgi:hypothetical protein
MLLCEVPIGVCDRDQTGGAIAPDRCSGDFVAESLQREEGKFVLQFIGALDVVVQ